MRNILSLYQNSQIIKKFRQSLKKNSLSYTLYADIDNTFYRQGREGDTEKLCKYLDDNSFGLVLVTVRSFNEVGELALLNAVGAVVSSIGTEIYIRQSDGSYLPDREYEKLLAQNWSLNTIQSAITNLQREHTTLIFQPRYKPEGGTNVEKYRTSLFYYGSFEEAESICHKLEASHGAKGIITPDLFQRDKMDIDLVPYLQGKRNNNALYGKNLAVAYLQEKLKKDGVVAGDSMSDFDMLIKSGLPGIVVSGAHPKLINYLKRLKSINNKIKILPNRQLIYVGEADTDIAANGILNALTNETFIGALRGD